MQLNLWAFVLGGFGLTLQPINGGMQKRESLHDLDEPITTLPFLVLLKELTIMDHEIHMRRNNLSLGREKRK